jgi:hypothetical protein
MIDTLQSDPITHTPLSLPVDAEHSGIRTVGCFTFFAASVAAFFLFSLLLSGLLTLMLALLTGAAIAFLADYWMKRHWPSGRRLVVDQGAVQVMQNDKVEMTVDASRQVNVLPWRFTVKRNGRVKKGWYVIALGLEQDDLLLPVYTFASPDRFEELPLKSLFTALQREDKKEKGVTGSARELKQAGLQHRLQDAEKARSLMGAEVTIEQFETYLQTLQTQFPQWMPQK